MRRNVILLALAVVSCTAPKPYGPVPGESQLEWQKMEMNMFVHFGPNTFTSAEWGSGTEAEDIFNPTELDCRQWAATAKAAGMNGIIITAKHHDGFCLWPNPVSTHTVAQSSWKNGRGDVLKELSDACREYGLKFGVYISPWDRNDPAYGTPQYNQKFADALTSVHDGTYGPIFEQWFDGANGEGPNGRKQEYDWPLFYGAVQPGAVIFGDWGPGCRWVGNEDGYAPETAWSTLDNAWVPIEADVSIRPGWFWKESENDKVKSARELREIWYGSVGRNALLLLNVPPDTRGRIHPVDSMRLMEFRRLLDADFAHNLAEGASAKPRARAVLDGKYDTYWTGSALDVVFPEEKAVSMIVLQEYIPLGQRVESFSVKADGREIAAGTTIGYKRILRLEEPARAGSLHFDFSAPVQPVINNIEIY